LYEEADVVVVRLGVFFVSIKCRGRRCLNMVLVGKTGGKRPLERPRCRRQDIKMDIQEVGCEGMD